MENQILLTGAVVVGVVVLTPLIVNAFLRDVDAGEIRLVSWLNGRLRIYRGPCKAPVIPVLTVSRVIPASAINVDIEITDQTADVDGNGSPAPVKVTVRASAIVSVGEEEGMVNTAANKFFSKSAAEQLSTLTDVLSSAGRRAINLLRHDQLFNSRASATVAAIAKKPAEALAKVPGVESLVARGEDDELAVIIKDACSRELMDLGLSFNSLNIKAVLSEVAEARRRESAARAKASADVVQAQEEQRAKIAQLEAAQKINDQERELKTQIASNGAAIAKADAEQNVIANEAEGRAQAVRIRAVAEAEADAILKKAQALRDAGSLYLDLRRLELAPDLTRAISSALENSQFVNFGGGGNGSSAVTSGSDDILRVVQTLMAAQVITQNSVVPNGVAVPVPELPAAPRLPAAKAKSQG